MDYFLERKRGLLRHPEEGLADEGGEEGEGGREGGEEGGEEGEKK